MDAGRGFGKTRTGAEYVRWRIERCGAKRIALIARTAADARDVMVEGEAGLLSVCPPWNRPQYEPSKRRLTWPNGAIATTYSAEEPKHLRGPAHDTAWCDELASWRFAAAWDMMTFGLRLGRDPRVVVTTTPTPTKLFRDVLRDPTTVVTGGSTYDNRANLAPKFFDQLVRKYEGTRLGRQELRAELLEDTPGALWTRNLIEGRRVSDLPIMKRIVVAIDPATTNNENSDEAGIIVAGLGMDGKGYVLEDISLQASPMTWAKEAVAAYHKFRADRIIAETNNGGDMIEALIRVVDSAVSYKKITASRGKIARAEPVAALYEQGRVHHVGTFAMLEDQMCSYVPGVADSPDRMDALVWALTELMVGNQPIIAETRRYA